MLLHAGLFLVLPPKDMQYDPNTVLVFLLFFRSGAQALSVRAQAQNLGGNHNATLRILRVLHSLLVVDRQYHPDAILRDGHPPQAFSRGPGK